MSYKETKRKMEKVFQLSPLQYPRRESNSNLRFRKPLFYPLNYKGLFNAQFTMQNAQLAIRHQTINCEL